MIRVAACSGVAARRRKWERNLSIAGLVPVTPAISTVLTRPVSTAPGQTRLTRIPWRRRSKRSTSETPRRPNLVALRGAELVAGVGGVPRRADKAGGRRDVDQVTAAAGADHRRDERLDHVDRAHQV